MNGFAKIAEVAATLDGRLTLVRSYGDGPLLFSLAIRTSEDPALPGIVPRHRQAKAIEIAATRGACVLSTVKLTQDQHGLPLRCESLYPEAVSAIRSTTTKLGELGSITIVEPLDDGLPAMCAVYQLTLLQARAIGMDCLLVQSPIEEAVFLQQAFGFRRTCSEPRLAPLGRTPLVLLQGRVRDLQDRVALSRQRGEGRNPLRNAFGEADEARLLCEMQLAYAKVEPSPSTPTHACARTAAPTTILGAFA